MPTLLKTYLENRWLVQPHHANNLGSTHGGTVLKWMDELGALSAMRFSGSPCVTARMDQVNFANPIPVGETALVESYVYGAGETSVDVRLRTFREAPTTGERELTTESYSVYVAVDEAGDPVSVPSLTVESERGAALQQAAREDEPAADE
jgi:acyl-CoA hydrolase